jgi:hypothetical protein
MGTHDRQARAYPQMTGNQPDNCATDNCKKNYS